MPVSISWKKGEDTFDQRQYLFSVFGKKREREKRNSLRDNKNTDAQLLYSVWSTRLKSPVKRPSELSQLSICWKSHLPSTGDAVETTLNCCFALRLMLEPLSFPSPLSFFFFGPCCRHPEIYPPFLILSTFWNGLSITRSQRWWWRGAHLLTGF